jgi:plasmid stabilization system protein ParE
MSLPAILRPEAEADIRTIYGYLEQVRLGLGKKFLSQLTEVLERIESFPELYGVVWQDVRAARLKKFRYVLYYVIFQDRVEILGVIHGSRHESAWKSRM